MRLENLKSYPVPESNSRNNTLYRSKIFLNNTLSYSFFGQSCALLGNWYEIYRKLWKYCHPSNLNHIHRVQMAFNDLLESKMTNMDPVMELIFTEMIPCPGVGILKMIPCSAARPRTVKYISTPRVRFKEALPLERHYGCVSSFIRSPAPLRSLCLALRTVTSPSGLIFVA